MRIVVSGTHASGKSTLVADFAALHPGYEVLPDPFELLDDASAEPDAGMFFAQLRIAAARLLELGPDDDVIAERGPLDLLAYLVALDDLGRATRATDPLLRGRELTERAMAHVDLLVLLPLSAHDRIDVPDDEDPELRAAMDDALLELADDPDLVGAATVVEIVGDPATRLGRLRAAVS